MENLSCLISKKASDMAWQPIYLSREGPLISHLFFFADDVLLFAKASTSHMWLMIKVVSDFCNA